MKTFVKWVILFSAAFVLIGEIFGLQNMTFMGMIDWVTDIAEGIAKPFRSIVDIFDGEVSAESATWWADFNKFIENVIHGFWTNG